jgi:hypothetical protein
MKKPVVVAARAASLTPARTSSSASQKHRIHPVVIYPFRQPNDYSDLEALYEFVARLDANRREYARPLTVIDRKTHYAMEDNERFSRFRKNTVARHSDILDVWCVDTCQMWYSGLGRAFEEGERDDIYWLIPGDFNYGTATGQEVLGRLHDLPEIIQELKQDVCIGEIAADPNNSKQLIDTYGTFALLYNWFPSEAQEIRQFTERPRSEFFAVCHSFLREALTQRWFAYEQTVVMLLQAVFLPQTNQPIFGRADFRFAFGKRVRRRRHATSGTDRAGAENPLARAQSTQAGLDRTIPRPGSSIRPNSAHRREHSPEPSVVAGGGQKLVVSLRMTRGCARDRCRRRAEA